MWHVDSGTLHAYLDNQLDAGARPGRQQVESHLAECAECRALLEEARRLRDRAQGILSESGPQQVVAPPFAEVLARAARQRMHRSNRRLVVLAWAASLALAVTVGWYARNLVITRRPSGQVATNVVATEPQPRAAEIEAKPPAARQAAQAAPARRDTGPAEAPLGAGVPAVSSTTGVAAQNRPVIDVALAEAKGAVDTEARKLAEAPAPAAPAPAAARAPVPRAAMRVAQPSQAEVMPVPGWVTVTPAEAARRLGGPLAMIPGLPSLGTSVAGAGESVVVRTIQVLGPGQTIELTQQRAAARERAVAPAARPQAGAALRDEGTGLVTVQWQGFSVSGRAPVPQDSVRKLLQRLTAAEPPK